MSSKKGWINRKTAVRFEVLGRADGSALEPLDARAETFLNDHSATPLEDTENEPNSEHNNESDGESSSDDEAYVDDEETLRTLPRRGYDYSQHLRETGSKGGVFVARGGGVVPSEQRPQLEPSELRAMYHSESALLERMHGQRVESIADPEVAEALEHFDEGNYETLDDDFLRELREDKGDANKDLGSAQAQERVRLRFDDDELPPMTGDATSKDKGKGKGKARSLNEVDSDFEGFDESSEGEGQSEDLEDEKKTRVFVPDPEDLEDDDDDLEESVIMKKMRLRDPTLRYKYEPKATYEDDEEGLEMGDEDEDQVEEEEGTGRRRGDLAEDHFDVALKKFEADMFVEDEDLGSDEESVPHKTGAVPASAFNHIFDAFLAKGMNRKVAYRTPTDRKRDGDEDSDSEGNNEEEAPELIPAQAEAQPQLPEANPNVEIDEDAATSSDEELELLRVRPPAAQWDAESVLSTYSNTDNHPKLLGSDNAGSASYKGPRIHVNRRGIASLRTNEPLTEQDEAQEEENEESEEEEEEEGGRPNKGAKRIKGESAEVKKARKAAAKAERQERRIEKKEMKSAFQSEELRQKSVRAHAGPMANRTIIKF